MEQEIGLYKKGIEGKGEVRGRLRTQKIPGQRDIFYTFSFSFIPGLLLILVIRKDLILACN